MGIRDSGFIISPWLTETFSNFRNYMLLVWVKAHLWLKWWSLETCLKLTFVVLDDDFCVVSLFWTWVNSWSMVSACFSELSVFDVSKISILFFFGGYGSWNSPSPRSAAFEIRLNCKGRLLEGSFLFVIDSFARRDF